MALFHVALFRWSSARASAAALATLGLLGVAGCGGGGGGGSAIGLPSPRSGDVTFTIEAPPASVASGSARAPQYISPATRSIAIAIAGGGTTIVNLQPSPPDCMQATPTGPLVCTVRSLPSFDQTFTLTLYDGPNGTGAALSTAKVVAGPNTRLPIVLDGIVSALSVALSPNAVPVGQRASIAVIVNALDAAGKTIIGPGRYVDRSGAPLTVRLHDSDASGTTRLSRTTIDAPASDLLLEYDGGPLSSAEITADAPGIASASATLTVTPPGPEVRFLDTFARGFPADRWTVSRGAPAIDPAIGNAAPSLGGCASGATATTVGSWTWPSSGLTISVDALLMTFSASAAIRIVDDATGASVADVAFPVASIVPEPGPYAARHTISGPVGGSSDVYSRLPAAGTWMRFVFTVTPDGRAAWTDVGGEGAPLSARRTASVPEPPPGTIIGYPRLHVQLECSGADVRFDNVLVTSP